MQGPKCEGALVPSGAAGKLRISILACLVSALLEATSYSAWVVGRAVGRPRSFSQGVEPRCFGRVQAFTERVATGANPLHACGAHVGGWPCVCVCAEKVQTNGAAVSAFWVHSQVWASPRKFLGVTYEIRPHPVRQISRHRRIGGNSRRRAPGAGLAGPLRASPPSHTGKYSGVRVTPIVTGLGVMLLKALRGEGSYAAVILTFSRFLQPFGRQVSGTVWPPSYGNR